MLKERIVLEISLVCLVITLFFVGGESFLIKEAKAADNLTLYAECLDEDLFIYACGERCVPFYYCVWWWCWWEWICYPYCFGIDLIDCGEDSYDPWGPNYCKGDDIYHSRVYHNRGCGETSEKGHFWGILPEYETVVGCYDDTSIIEELVEDCSLLGANCSCEGSPPTCKCPNSPPKARISCNPSCTVYETEVLILENNSTDPDGDIVKSEWSIGEEVRNICSQDPLCDFTPQNWVGVGSYTAKLYVEDAKGLSDTTFKNFQIKAITVEEVEESEELPLPIWKEIVPF